jgi:hypothetical protein
MSDTTSFEAQCEILGDFWLEQKDSDNFSDFMSYNDLGLPLAYAFSSGILSVDSAPALAKSFIQETFTLLLESFDISEDTGFDSIEEIMVSGN